MDPENQLVAAARGGDKAAAAQLIELFYARIFAFLRRLSANDADAADLTQRTFGRVWQALPGFAGRSTVGSWMHGIAYHVYVDWRRSERKSEPRSDEWWAARSSAEAAPDALAADHDLAARLYATVDQLEAGLRDTIHLHYYQELTLQETANAMNVAISTVKYRRRLALAELQKIIATESPVLKQPTSIKTS